MLSLVSLIRPSPLDKIQIELFSISGFLVKSLVNKNCLNYRTRNDINMKFEPLSKVDLRENQLTGFYMIGTSVMKDLNELSKKPSQLGLIREQMHFYSLYLITFLFTTGSNGKQHFRVVSQVCFLSKSKLQNIFRK